MTENRNIKTNWESAISNPGIQVIDITERLRDTGYWFETVGMAFPPAVIAFFAGVGWGRSFVELGTIAISANLAAVTFGFSFALVVYLFVLVLHIATTTNKYYAAKEEGEEEEGGDGLVATNNPRQLVRLDGRMKALLKKFARRYPAVQTLAINRWEGGNSPFTRPEIRDLRTFLLRINAASQEGRRVELNTYGTGKLSEWAAGNFNDTPLPQNGDISPDIEVSHS